MFCVSIIKYFSYNQTAKHLFRSLPSKNVKLCKTQKTGRCDMFYIRVCCHPQGASQNSWAPCTIDKLRLQAKKYIFFIFISPESLYMTLFESNSRFADKFLFPLASMTTLDKTRQLNDKIVFILLKKILGLIFQSKTIKFSATGSTY